MRITILGSGTGWIRLDRNSPGYLVEKDGFLLVLDLGYGVLKQILKLGYSLEDLSAIFISHFHPDHLSDLIPFFFASRYKLGYRRLQPVHVYAPKGFLTFLEKLNQALNHWVEPPKEIFRLIELPLTEGYEFSIGPFKAKTSPVKHNPESLAIRLETQGKSLVYSGDTGFCSSLIRLAEKADVLILECANSEDFKVEGHLSPTEAGVIAEESRVGKLILSHFYPHSEKKEIPDIIKKHFSGEVILAEDFMVLTL
ncbi:MULTISPECIES: ribonuclease Z [Thermodesulfobacterium]|jgi:ribonuclease BN (tRNA processing enzyme)|uniref:Beta-lactamase n=2 Tax=Thermodesulfobacterium commune TaxID=1741 RepID=A0A075WSY9_9BACT|nr:MULTISPECIES: ribonuclease Z [Thermodesulfobacterium]KUJ97593.1 MAG: Beta-lactamase domain protein [Thermodesulfobacterium sp. 37_54]KUK19472.1 MAG: Beta-lactamase domain protein [Thermodesulfobacterium commune]AIH03523.1 beta-lactamase [Thermodesulfobacterium commune DSM 2178]KUK38422.1 MAG: Beta-lactamase domain protein [Thermodesulfobacterium commune]MBZ4681014.1 beta-lactamase [Thermodesulfobacterium sp.]